MTMSFTDQNQFTATEGDTKKRWGSGFWCKLCGHEFKAGDTVRWVYANGTPGQGTGNFFVCTRCDGDDVLIRAKKDLELAIAMAKRWGIYAK